MRRNRTVLAATVAAASAAALTISANANAAVPTDTSALRNAVTAEGILAHQEALQQIADAHNGTRASGTPGFTASADYVAGLLTDAGYDVTRQQFDFPFFSETAPAVFENVTTGTAYAEGTDFATMEYSGSGDTTAPVQDVDLVLPPAASANTSTSGCEASDFAGFTPGNVALIQRGTCSFALKAQNAEAAGASAAIIFNEGQDGRTDAVNGTLGGPGVTIPVLGVSFAVGDALAGTGDTVHVFTETFFEVRSTENVIADTTTGRADRTVVVGAHLDSVEDGPGINDNGSGTATILETALQMADLGIEPRNRVRFAFWGAEEAGLLGSEHYVASLSKAELKNVMLNLNFDMLASPNYVRFVYDGDGSATGASGPNGSGHIESVFTDYFASQGLASEPTPFNGRSDYGPFIDQGIPAGGLFTGAEGVKTADQAAMYGGVAGAAYDSCYHQACDSLTPTYDSTETSDLFALLGAEYDLVGNVNLDALDEMSDAVAHATQTFAMTTSSVNGTSKASSGSSDFKGSSLQR